MTIQSLPLLLTLCLFCPGAVSQTPIGATTWTRTAFEAGVVYTAADQIASTTTTCPAYGWAADWYQHFVTWGDESQPNLATHDGAIPKLVPYNGVNRMIVFNGTNPVYADLDKSPVRHSYDPRWIGKTLTAKVLLRLHCLDGTYPYIDFYASQPVTIYDRIPVDEVKVSPAIVKGGESFTVEIILTSPAQPSNTRVDLTFAGDGLDLLGGTPPDHVDIPGPATSIVLTVPTLKDTGGPKSVTISATTKTNKKSTVRITP
jgi:hypothetical protein